MARGGGGGSNFEGTWVPMEAPAELTGASGYCVAVYLALRGLFFLERVATSFIPCAHVVTSTWGSYAGALSPAAAPPFKNPRHTLLLPPPG